MAIIVKSTQPVDKTGVENNLNASGDSSLLPPRLPVGACGQAGSVTSLASALAPKNSQMHLFPQTELQTAATPVAWCSGVGM